MYLNVENFSKDMFLFFGINIVGGIFMYIWSGCEFYCMVYVN